MTQSVSETPSIRKHSCPDCKMCQGCSEPRCQACRSNSEAGHQRVRKLSIREQIELFNRLNPSLAPDEQCTCENAPED